MRTYRWVLLLTMCMVLCGVMWGEQSKHMRNGMWGGDQARMQVTDNGATIEFGCANGEIAEPISLDGQGRFQVKGSFTAQTPGPSRAVDSVDATNATYNGRVSGDTLQLEITVNGEKHNYTLTRGKSTKILGCK